MSQEKTGFIGLGNIGKPIAANIARAGFGMIAYDIAGTAERAPAGAVAADSVREVAENSSVIFLSLPSLTAFHSVIDEIAASTTADNLVVVNTSTTGSAASKAAHEKLQSKGSALVDSPVSGGVFRAEEGTLAIMYSGAPALLERLRPVLETFSANIFNIGPEPGQGQRMKLVNNCLVISAFVNTSQALAYGEKGGIDLKTMLDVVNVSTGQNFVTKEYFPRFALNGSFDSAGANAIICKDLSLFIEEAEKEGSFNEVAKSMLKVIEALEETRPGADQMLLYPFLRDGR
jgi:3-hydroxyisobutyrate dehydrogenase-like beta-hydroxyacid dehydrogenase